MRIEGSPSDVRFQTTLLSRFHLGPLGTIYLEKYLRIYLAVRANFLQPQTEKNLFLGQKHIFLFLSGSID